MQMTAKAQRPVRHLAVWTVVVALCGIHPTLAADPAPNPNATLIYFDAVSNQTLDPQEPQNNSSFSQGVLMAVYEALTQLDEDGNHRGGSESGTVCRVGQ